MCFGSRGNAKLKGRGYFSQARITAEKAQSQPYFVTIGGGDQVPNDLRGHLLELVRATGVYGETLAFVRDEELKRRLAQWPVAVVISELYSFVDEPHLIQDLRFSDRKILMKAHDSVIRDENQSNASGTQLKIDALSVDGR